MNRNNFEERTIEIVTTEQEVGSATPASNLALLRTELLSGNYATVEDIDRIQCHTRLNYFRGQSIGDGIVTEGIFLVLLGIYLEPCHLYEGDLVIQCYRIIYLYCDDENRMYMVREFLDRYSCNYEVVRENVSNIEFIYEHFYVSNYSFDMAEQALFPQGIGDAIGFVAGGVGHVANLPGTVDKCSKDIADIHQTISSLSGIINEQVSAVRKVAELFATVDSQGIAFVERILSRLEDFGLVSLGLFSATTWQSAIVILLQYFKSFVPGSAIKLLSEKFDDLRRIIMSWRFGPDGIQQQGIEFSFLETISWLNINWHRIRSSEAAKRLGDIVTIMLTFLCGGSKTESFIHSKAYEIFRLKAWNPVKGGTLGFVDTLLATFQFCVEKGAQVIETGSIASIFYSDKEWHNIDIEYLRVVEWSKVALSNRLANIDELSEGIFSSEDDYRYRLNTLRDRLYKFRKVEKNVVNQQKIDGMILKLGSIAVSIRLQKKSASYKEAPFTIMFYGDSSINKSLLMNASAKVIAQANGRPSGHDTICCPNESDKYDTEYDDEKHNTLFIDDILNTKVDWYDVPPTDRILRVKNNQPHTVLKADVDSKGAMTWLVKTMIMSTNVKDLKAHLFSNLAASIMRRIDYVITVYLKDEFKDELGGFTNPTDDILPSAWNFRVQKVKLVAHGEYDFTEEYSTSDISEMMKYLAERSVEHSKLQRKVVDNVNSVFSSGFCPHFKIGNCPHCKDGETLGELSKQGVCQRQLGPNDRIVSAEEASQAIRDSIYELDRRDAQIREILVNPSFVPDRSTVNYINERLEQHVIAESNRNSSFGEEFKNLMAGYANDASSLFEFLKSNWKVGAAIGAVGAVIAGIISMSRAILACVYPQSVREIAPEPIEGERENVWKARKFRSVPLIRRSQMSASTTCTDLTRMISKDIRACKISSGNASGLCNLLPLGGEFWLGPAHSLVHPGVVTLCLADCGKGELGIDGVLEKKKPSDVIQIPGTDYAVVRLTSTPPKRGFLKYFPEGEVIGPTVATCIYRPRSDYVAQRGDRLRILQQMEESDGCYTTLVQAESVNKHRVGDMAYNGYKYAFPAGTFNGLCGMALVIQARGAVILGLHLAGSEGSSPVGIAGAITIAQLETAISAFSHQYIELVGEGGVDDVQYGYDFNQPGLQGDVPINPKHCMNFMDSAVPSAVEVYGAHIKGTRTLRSDVRTSYISRDVEDIMGLPNIHGKPKGIGTWRPFQSNAQNMMVPCNAFDPDLLEKAADDMFEHHRCALIDNYGILSVHFVSDEVAINGIPGMCGFDRIDLSTSAGHPIDKSKLTLVDMEKSTVDDYGVIQKVVFVDEIYHRVKHLEAKALAGERLHVIFRANVKDEPTKLSKEQLRVFAGTPLDYLILCKKALSALNRVMQIHWHKFECCISANCYDDDWTKLYNSIYQPGCDDRFFCGDYKHWDKTLSPTLLRAAAGVIIRMCETCGYNQEELTIVNAVLLELIYPIYEWDGVYAQFLSSMPSGVFLTVMMSNICNGILFRYTFYSVAPKGEKFSDHIKCNFMGDDNLGTVGTRCTWWDQKVHARILGEIGIEYTAADKTSELEPFVQRQNCTYLKRKFVWDPELDNYVAPIEETSIGKTLHNYMKRKKSNDTPEMISGNAIDFAVNEYFRHGRDVYEKRCAQLFEIIKKNNMYIYCHCLINNRMPTYQEMVEKYRKAILSKYASREASIPRADTLGEALLLDFQ